MLIELKKYKIESLTVKYDAYRIGKISNNKQKELVFWEKWSQLKFIWMDKEKIKF